MVLAVSKTTWNFQHYWNFFTVLLSENSLQKNSNLGNKFLMFFFLLFPIKDVWSFFSSKTADLRNHKKRRILLLHPCLLTVCKLLIANVRYISDDMRINPNSYYPQDVLWAASVCLRASESVNQKNANHCVRDARLTWSWQWAVTPPEPEIISDYYRSVLKHRIRTWPDNCMKTHHVCYWTTEVLPDGSTLTPSPVWLHMLNATSQRFAKKY